MSGEDERGSIAIEAAILTPALLLFLLLVIASGRIETAKGVVDAASRDAARSASLARTPDAAVAAAQDSASVTLDQEGVSCQDGQLAKVDTSQFAPALGEAGEVTVTVSCTVQLADVAVSGLPGSLTMTSSFTSVVDGFRAR